MKPFLKINHRFGKVFLHFVRMSKLGRVSTVYRMAPEEAERLGRELVGLAERAKGEKTQKATLKIKRVR